MEMPEWIKNNENCEINIKKNDYLKKNFNRFFNLLKFLKKEPIYNEITNISTFFRILSLIMSVFLITICRGIFEIWICLLFVMIQLSLNRGKVICSILKKSLIMFIFPCIIFLPYCFYAPFNVIIPYYLKILIIMILVQNFIANATIYEIAESLKQMHCPDIIIFITDIIVKYLKCITYLMCDVLQAVIMRNIGEDSHEYNTIGGLFGNIFIKMKRCGESLSCAMECRGFSGSYVRKTREKIKKMDVIFILFNIIFVCIYFYVRSYEI
ncbi:energy-coupling factor transporter transmembrane component T [Clostridium sp. BJN0001]|uniref:energy-coupling factor transporter transmembrane component T n=1 Tax=Clostridium sp. BJN0001 TaxID=2930219 RepID=UPI001FD15CE8|nr:energy-coupling factor transporter transmembrane component T [Clostridium sp. BJN0001]